MSPWRYAQIFLGTFLSAAFALRWWQLPAYPPWIWLTLLHLAFVLCIAWMLPSARKGAAIVLCCVVAIVLAFACVARITPTRGPIDLSTYASGQRVRIVGTISSEPDRRPMDTRYTIAVNELTTESGTILYPVHGTLLAVDSSGWPQYSYGQRVSVEGSLITPEPIEDFRYDRYLARYGITALVQRARITPDENVNRTLLGTLYAFKNRFEDRLNRLYPEPHASFLAGLLTGSRRGIPKQVSEDFNAVGLTHIIAISGTNVAIILIVIGGLLFWLPLRLRFWPSVVAIAVFVLFVGASASVVRAGIMGGLGLLALQTGRTADARMSVLWTAAIMTASNPAMLWDDAGFQLSLLAVLGLIEIGPLLEPWLRWLPGILGIREALQMTIAAQIGTLPLLVMLFGRLSWIAPIANLLAAPAIAPAMLFGFLSALLGNIPLIGTILILGTWGCLQWIILVAHVLAKLPDVPAPHVSPVLFVAYYAVLAGFIAYGHRLQMQAVPIGTGAVSAYR